MNIKKSFTKEQNKDSGLALLLILLLLGLFTDSYIYFKLMIPVLLIVMTIPTMIFPFTIIWLNFAEILGTVVSKILLTIVYFLLVFPVGVVRKIAGKDSLNLKNFRQNDLSAFKIIDKKYTPSDLEKPY
ncbi:MAG: hypothetical protein K9J12_00855 [Melioribacteraceae bacterium]|nr:hypothetical protein [Melioribacteraceae bacterium]MCF8266407.1 hypothetical protein [Melioribacteraceae bacterium]MCF8413385.1 hypothetical protein [Melioribacteraceae bacterium]